MNSLFMVFLSGYKNWIIAGAIAICISFVYMKGYSNGKEKGFNSGQTIGINTGIKQERGRLDAEYASLLEKKLTENTINLQKQFDLRLSSQEKHKEIEIKYVDRIKIVEKVIRESGTLNNEVCIANKSVIDTINTATKKVGK